MPPTQTISTQFVAWLQQSLSHVSAPSKDKPIVLHEPWFCGNEQRYVADCIETGWVSSAGSYVTRFEKELAQVFGVQHAVATMNGTAALHLCLELLDVSREDEVLIPALTFIATANAVAYTGATPHFVESCPKTFAVDPAALEAYLESMTEITETGCINKHTQKQIKALIVVHVFGHAANMVALQQVCQRFNIELIEDAAESIGSFIGTKSTGGFGKLAATSFNGNKTITTGGGGAILTNDAELAQRAKHLSTTAKLPHAWAFNHNAMGYNYRLPNINAALGCAQLENLAMFLSHKRQLAHHYQAQCQGQPFSFMAEPEGTTSNYWLNTLQLPNELANQRNAILEASHAQGYLIRPVWTLMSELPMYSHCPSMPLPVATQLEQTLINLPSSAFLGAELH